MSPRPLRSVLYVPASNPRALDKLASLAPDAAILDLEDAVAPEEKRAARERVSALLANRQPSGPLVAVRINGLSTEWGADDLAAVLAGPAPDSVLLPKVDTARELLDAGDRMDEADAPETLRLWAMIETPRGVLNLGAIAELGRDRASRLDALVAGTNDLAAELGLGGGRPMLLPYLAQVLLAARAGGLFALDGTFNDFRDADGFRAEAREAALMGFDGKTLIHPAQILPAVEAFTPDGGAVERARAVVEAFARPENAGKAVVALDGRMVERLHLRQAERVLARAGLG